MEVYFTPLAQEALDFIVKYLNATWGTQIKNEFLDEIDRCIELIRKEPTLFPLFGDFPNVRRYVISAFNSLFYRIENEQIQVLTIWDNRMNPDYLNQIIFQAP